MRLNGETERHQRTFSGNHDKSILEQDLLPLFQLGQSKPGRSRLLLRFLISFIEDKLDIASSTPEALPLILIRVGRAVIVVR